MNKRGLLVLTVGAVALVLASGLFASNMGFKLNLGLDSPGSNGSATGVQDIALPYNQQTSLVTAADLRNDLNATVPGSVVSIGRFVKQLDALEVYSGGTTFPVPGSNVNFNLTPGEGLRLKVSAPLNYIVVGSHDPGLVVILNAPGSSGSASGQQLFSYPYHSTSATASDLRAEINAQGGGNAVVAIQRYVRTTDVLEVYSGGTTFPVPGSNANFALTPGSSYIVKVSSDVAFVPSHY